MKHEFVVMLDGRDVNGRVFYIREKKKKKS